QPVRGVAAQLAHREVGFILTDTYHTAAEIAFYWPQRIAVYITGSSERRFNQYDLWPGIEREAGRDGLYISRRQSLPPLVDRAFAHCRPLASVEGRAHYGRRLRTLYPYLCRDYRPIDWPHPRGY
ncbi:MAG: hypothetical protein R3310_11265, partial [Candidatus Competibacteraceae bacterium]|nr:hypothetical protein [Candidatus Competibacteraceae bacterium]